MKLTWLDSVLKQNSSLILLPEAVLYTLPFEALNLSKSNSGLYKDADWLGLKYAVRYVHSGSMMLGLSNFKSKSTRDKKIALGIAPDYSSNKNWDELPVAIQEMELVKNR
ncbi:MAG: CHAT domain-containing protein, partial [Limisphaerales bacterium]